MSGDERLLIAGMAAYRRRPPPPAVQRRHANRAAFDAEMQLRLRPGAAEGAVRRAIEMQVDAFLIARRENAAAFARAHRLGADAYEQFGCRLTPEGPGLWANECGILALHSRIGQSFGGRLITQCTLCGAGAFNCGHVEGDLYDGETCNHVVMEWDAIEVSLTSRPADPRCYRLQLVQTEDEIEEGRGRPLGPGEAPTCDHCRRCSGWAGPNEDDLDTSRFSTLPVDEESTNTGERSRSA